MSIIKSIKQVLGLGPAAENHFWDGSVPNQLSLKRGTPDAPGAELIKALNGVLSFPNSPKLAADNGYFTYQGFLVQWSRVTSGSSFITWNFPTAFAARPYVITGNGAAAAPINLSVVFDTGSATAAGVPVACVTSANAHQSGILMTLIAIGLAL